MKKMLHSLPHPRWPTYYRMLNRRLLFKTNMRNHHPSFLRFWNWAKKLSMQPKFVAAQKMLLKRNPASIRKPVIGFITLGIYTPLEARVYCSQ